MSEKGNQPLESLQGKATSTGKEKAFDIFTVLGHDLKSPLNAVEAYLDILRGRVLGDALDPYMTILDNSVARLHQMRELITDVVDWSKIRQSQPGRVLAITDLSKTARLMLDRYIQQAQARNIIISADIEDGMTMKAAPDEIELLVRHLMDNALRYNKDNGSVCLTLKRAGDYIILKVADTGIGMSEEDLSRLFEEFVRIKNSKTQDIRGTGLGLAIVRNIVELYQGTVSVRSEPDAGTTLIVELPCE